MELQKTIYNILCEISTESPAEKLNPSAEFREFFELDSMDMLEFYQELQKNFTIEFPVEKMAEMKTINDIISFVSKMSDQIAS